MSKTKIGILGSGIVGKVLASGFLKYGYDVMIGSRSPEKLDDWLKENPGGKTGYFDEAASYGDILVLAVKGTVASGALKMSGGENLVGKIIIDATNPIDHQNPPENGVLKFFTSYNESLMEQLQKEFRDAFFVKAFNCVGNAFMVDPDFDGVKPTMFICGNNDKAKQKVTEILSQFGWETEDMGMVEAARAIEPLCILWCIPGFRENQWNHAFKMLKK